jgi:hypothetical protein
LAGTANRVDFATVRQKNHFNSAEHERELNQLVRIFLYHGRITEVVQPAFAAALMTRLHEAIASAS